MKAPIIADKSTTLDHEKKDHNCKLRRLLAFLTCTISGAHRKGLKERGPLQREVGLHETAKNTSCPPFAVPAPANLVHFLCFPFQAGTNIGTLLISCCISRFARHSPALLGEQGLPTKAGHAQLSHHRNLVLDEDA